MTLVPIMTRRDTLALSAAALTSITVPIAKAAENPERHGISAFGDLKYPADFKQFDYVNPKAPKGGLFSHVAPTRIFNRAYSRSTFSIASFSRAMVPKEWSSLSRA